MATWRSPRRRCQAATRRCCTCLGFADEVLLLLPALSARDSRIGALIEQPAMVRQILDHLGIAIPSRADRSPPVRRTPDSCGEAARGLSAREWTYDPVEDDLPPLDPLTI